MRTIVVSYQWSLNGGQEGRSHTTCAVPENCTVSQFVDVQRVIEKRVAEMMGLPIVQVAITNVSVLP